MSKKIFKFPLANEYEQSIDIPHFAKILSIQNQDGVITMWCEIDENVKHTARHKFWIVGTGEEVPECASHLATVQIDNLVWHIYH